MTIKKPRANSVISTAVDGKLVQFTVKDAGTLTLDMARLHADILSRAAVHGMVQRVSDAAAIARNTETGKSATPVEKFENMKRLVEHYNSGTAEWALRVAGEKRAPRAGLELDVLCEAYPEMTREKLAKWLKSKSAVERSALMAEPRLAPIYARLVEEATSAVDTDTLLIELELLGDEETESESESPESEPNF